MLFFKPARSCFTHRTTRRLAVQIHDNSTARPYFWSSHTRDNLLALVTHSAVKSMLRKFLRRTSFIRLCWVKKYKKWTHAAGFTKKNKKFARKFYSGLCKPSCLIDFVQISTLTVAFLDWVSKSVIKIKCILD